MPVDIIPPELEQYAASFSSPEDALLQEVLAKTKAYHPESHMLSGHVQGRFLAMISKMLQPRRILEIGTFTGYSALCLAEGLSETGELHTLELRDREADLAQSFFERSRYSGQLKLHRGNATEIIPLLQQTWDLVFIDADKPGYIDYFNLVLPVLNKNGFILADNTFFHGQVLESPLKGKNAIAIHAFNEHVRNCEEVEQVMLTVRDGISLIRKR